MAKRAKVDHAPPPPPDSTVGAPDGLEGVQTTGKYLVLFRQGAAKKGLETLRDAAGLRDMATTADVESGALNLAEVAATPVVVFDKLGVAVVSGDPQQFAAMGVASDEDSGILAIEPERIMRALSDGVGLPDPALAAGMPIQYLRGYRDAVVALYERLTQTGAAGAAEAGVAETFVDDDVSTWGLKATRVLSSRFSGRGIKVAVLDT